MHTAAGAALRLDRAALRPLAAAKATAGVLVPLVAGIVAGQPAAGATAAFGALSVGVAIITAGPRTPAGTMLAASVGMGGATFVGSISGLVPVVHLLVLASAGMLAGLLVAAGRGASQVGVNATIALLVFGRLSAGPEVAALHASWVLAGGLLQTGLAIALRSPRPLRTQREALAAAYDALAGAALPGATASAPSLQVAHAAVTARDAISASLQAGDAAAPLRGLADQLDRIRQEFHALHFLGTSLTEVDEALTLAGQALTRTAQALRFRQAVELEPEAARLSDLADQAGQAMGAPGPAPTGGDGGEPPDPAARFASARIAALAGQLRAVDRMTGELAGIRKFPVAAASYTAFVVLPGQLRSVGRTIWAAISPSSPAFRHGVRLAVVIPLATAIATVLPWQRGYWLPVTTVIVLKPDFTATISRGVARTVGTGLGILASALIVTVFDPHGPALIALVAVCAWLGYTVFAANYAVYAVFLTSLVIFLVAQGNPVSPVENRGFDTLIGGVIAIGAYLAWPTWEAKTLQAATADRFDAARRFLTSVLEVYLEPSAFDRAGLARLAADTRRAQSAVTASLQRARGEPARFRPDIDRYAGVLAAGRRIVAGTHALASHLQDAREHVAVPAAAGVVGQVGDAMAELLRAVRAGEPPAPLPDLRASQRQLVALTTARLTQQDRRGAILAALLDPLVDSIDTAADVLTGQADRAS